MYKADVCRAVISTRTKKKKYLLKSYRTQKSKSGRICRMCGNDPYPNYFFCDVCHHKIDAYEDG